MLVIARRAILLNFAVATTAFVGGLATLVASAYMEGVVHVLLPVSAGTFLYRGFRPDPGTGAGESRE